MQIEFGQIIDFFIVHFFHPFKHTFISQIPQYILLFNKNVKNLPIQHFFCKSKKNSFFIPVI